MADEGMTSTSEMGNDSLADPLREFLTDKGL